MNLCLSGVNKFEIVACDLTDHHVKKPFSLIISGFQARFAGFNPGSQSENVLPGRLIPSGQAANLLGQGHQRLFFIRGQCLVGLGFQLGGLLSQGVQGCLTAELQ